ncbi:uncharacterized protein RJT20DRAFT_124183 [Scheffersomyces xylosifermentans]|uniref:uncharacterized protein n=1 Tax=Scheffersomyces xylosifermentans TaxID=1304137 RepID=UPI00315D5AF0
MAAFKFSWALALVSAYLLYVLTYVCPVVDPQISSKAQLKTLSPIVYHTCSASNSYFKPVFHSTILPNYDAVVKPQLVAVDDALHIRSGVHATKDFIVSLDKDYKIRHFLESSCALFHSKVLELSDYLDAHVYPVVHQYKNVALSKIRLYIKLGKVQLVNSWNALNQKMTEFGVYQYYSQAQASLLRIEFVQKVVKLYNEFIEKLLATKSSINLVEKRKFLKQEFKNLIKFNQFYGSSKNSGDTKEKKNIAEIVNDILKKISDKGTDVEDDSDLSDDENPIVVLLTSTITVTDESTATDVGLEQITDPNLLRINEELGYWESKVNKTLQLAANNLEVEMKPILNRTIESIKPEISEILQTLHKKTYAQYQILNKKITEINKDYEKIKLTNDSTIESVGRQEIRDDIADTYKLPEDASQAVQKILIESHDNILVEYFRVIQDTIDILESFSESTIQDFSKQLTNLLDELQLEDDEVSWKTWKKFHRVKEEIFKFRDFIFNTANEYKLNKENNKDLNTLGLEQWNEYLRNVEFHVNYLVRDNDDYLKLVRAKANVAFQLREGIVRKLEELHEVETPPETEPEHAAKQAEVEAETEETVTEPETEQETEQETESETEQETEEETEEETESEVETEVETESEVETEPETEEEPVELEISRPVLVEIETEELDTSAEIYEQITTSEESEHDETTEEDSSEDGSATEDFVDEEEESPESDTVTEDFLNSDSEEEFAKSETEDFEQNVKIEQLKKEVLEEGAPYEQADAENFADVEDDSLTEEFSEDEDSSEKIHST